MGQLWSRPNVAAAVLAVAALSGCTASLKPNTDPSISTFITSVTDGSGNVHATLVEGPAPGANGGPSATVSGIAVMINGGSSQQALTGTGAFDRVIISVSGMNDYYELTLPAGVSAENIVMSANPDAYATNLSFNYAVASGTSIGAAAIQEVRFLRVGTGDIQISVAWDDSADVDLHVIDPNGEHIFFGHRDAVSGGTLDLDANASCNRTPPPGGGEPTFVSNENVVWAPGEGIPGTYTVFLHYWSACGLAQTNWVATIGRVGVAPQIFTGDFVGSASAIDTVSVFTH